MNLPETRGGGILRCPPRKSEAPVDVDLVKRDNHLEEFFG
jgi:hypothetical protein